MKDINFEGKIIIFFIIFCLACLDTISRNFKLKEYGTGVLLAIGCSVPEMTTNIISCFSERKEMVGFGFGVIVGSGVFGKFKKLLFGHKNTEKTEIIYFFLYFQILQYVSESHQSSPSIFTKKQLVLIWNRCWEIYMYICWAFFIWYIYSGTSGFLRSRVCFSLHFILCTLFIVITFLLWILQAILSIWTQALKHHRLQEFVFPGRSKIKFFFFLMKIMPANIKTE